MKARPKSERWVPSRAEEIARVVRQLEAEWDDASFAGRLKLVRARAGDISINQAANLCELDDQSWRNWENGGHVRDLEDVVRKIVSTFGCDGDWLLRGDKIPCFDQAQLWPVAVKDAS